MQDLKQSKRVEILSAHAWHEVVNFQAQKQAVEALEEGRVLFFPELKMQLNENELNTLVNAQVVPGTKNVSYNFNTGEVRGSLDSPDVQAEIKKIMHAYLVCTKELIASYFPKYISQI